MIGFTPVRVFLLCVAAAGVLVFLSRPTIDFDEGFFFQTAIHAVQTGTPGFPWTDAFFGKSVPFIPLNSLLPLINWPLAYLPQAWWLFAGRLVSLVSVIGALIILFFSLAEVRRTSTDYAIAFFAATCLPLWLHARLIRPEALLLLTFCAALALVHRPSNLRIFVAGVLCGAAILLHTIQGPIIALIVVAAAVTGHFDSRVIIKLLLLGCGVVLYLLSFYGWYIRLVGMADLQRQIVLFAGNTPLSASSHQPWAQFSAWLSYIRGQLNVIPLLGVALIAMVAPFISSNSETYRVRLFQLGIIGLMIFWIFLYPKKAFSPVVVLLPLAWYILTAVRFTRTTQKVVLTALMVCIAANAILSLRYHFRLLRAEPSRTGPEAVCNILSEAGIFQKRGRVIAKLWLVFSVPQTVEVWDVTVAPKFVPAVLSGDRRETMPQQPADAVVLESENGSFIDQNQAEIAQYCRNSHWRETTVHTTRYFTPLDLNIFIRPTADAPEAVGNEL
jgi:hypothetical protein